MVKNKRNIKVNEIYNLEKNGKESTVETKGAIKENSTSNRKEEKRKENKILRNIFISIVIFILLLLLAVFVVRSSNQFKYENVKFTKIQEGQLTLYQTSFPIIYQGKKSIYNLYLRNDPRQLEKNVKSPATIPLSNTVINITQEFDCDGYQVIAIANMVNLYNAIGKKIIKDENASCDSLGRYMYLVIQPGKETSIEKVGPNCYNININKCEILQGTERFIIGMLSTINSNTSN